MKRLLLIITLLVTFALMGCGWFNETTTTTKVITTTTPETAATAEPISITTTVTAPITTTETTTGLTFTTVDRWDLGYSCAVEYMQDFSDWLNTDSVQLVIFVLDELKHEEIYTYSELREIEKLYIGSDDRIIPLTPETTAKLLDLYLELLRHEVEE